MHNRFIRDLPYPKVDHISAEIASKIRAIPDDVVPYSDAEVRWMKIAIYNLDRMIELSKWNGLNPKAHVDRKDQIESQLKSALSQCTGPESVGSK